MSLLLLFSDQIQAPASGDALTTMLVETTTGTWVDVTGDLISGTIVRGRQNQLDQYQAGTADVLLDNDDRKFDPTYASSPLNGYIVPMKRVQLKQTYNGVTYPLFTGYADRWTQNREGPHRGTTSLSASDGFKVFERARLASSAYAVEVKADNPTHWWRFGESAGSTVAVDDGNIRYNGTYTGGVTLGEDGALVNEENTSALFDGSNDFVTFGIGPLVAGTTYTIELWLKIADRSAITGWPTFFCQSRDNNTAANSEPWGIVTGSDLGDPGKVVWDACTSTSRVDDNAWHHVALVSNAGAQTLYIDGTAQATGTATSAGVNANEVLVGYPANAPAAAISRKYWLGGIDEVAIWGSSALSATRIAAHNTAGRTPWNGDLPGVRIGRVLDAIGWPALERNLDDGETVLQSAELDMPALEHVQKVSDTEFGNLYMTASGVVRFEDRQSSVNQAVLYAFSDAAGAGLPITFSNPEISDEQIRNDVTVSRLQGTAQNVRDVTSIATYLTSSYVRDGLYNQTDDHSRYLAQYILDAYKDPAERVSNMVVNPYAAPTTLWPAVLAMELTDRITLAETPQWVTPAVTRTLVVEGITHTFAAKSWSSSFNLSENTAATQAYWALGVTGYSELGQTTRLFF